jgi:hypothetical protein
MTLSDQILSFYKSLKFNISIPDEIEVMNPYQDRDVFELCSEFYHKFYNDNNQRTIIFGINPGRLGGGVTGVPFTDPVKLEKFCGIANMLPKKTELSADFIYQMIEEYGGTQLFYSRFFISAVCPLGFTRNGTNLNYYDDKALESAVEKFIITSLQALLTFPVNRDVCYCLGEGKNYNYFTKLNVRHNFFKEIIPLPHPRFIMQYKRKKMLDFINNYIDKLKLP